MSRFERTRLNASMKYWCLKSVLTLTFIVILGRQVTAQTDDDDAPPSGVPTVPTLTASPSTRSDAPTATPTSFAVNVPPAPGGFVRAVANTSGGCDPKYTNTQFDEFNVSSSFAACGSTCAANASCYAYDVDDTGRCRLFTYEIPVSIVGVDSSRNALCFVRAPPQANICVDVPNGQDIVLQCPSGSYIASVFFASSGGSAGSCTLGFDRTGYCDLRPVRNLVKTQCMLQPHCTVTSAAIDQTSNHSSCASGPRRAIALCRSDSRFLSSPPTSMPTTPSPTACPTPTCSGMCGSNEPQRRCPLDTIYRRTFLRPDIGLNAYCHCDSDCPYFHDCCDDFTNHCTTTSTTTETTTTTTWSPPTSSPSSAPSSAPSAAPVTARPSAVPSSAPTSAPTVAPSTSAPSVYVPPPPPSCTRHFHCEETEFCHLNAGGGSRGECVECNLPCSAAVSFTGHCPNKCIGYTTSSTSQTTTTTTTTTTRSLCRSGSLSSDGTVCCPGYCASTDRPYNCSAAGQQQYCADFPGECVPTAMRCNPVNYEAPYNWMPPTFAADPNCTLQSDETCIMPQ